MVAKVKRNPLLAVTQPINFCADLQGAVARWKVGFVDKLVELHALSHAQFDSSHIAFDHRLDKLKNRKEKLSKENEQRTIIHLSELDRLPSCETKPFLEQVNHHPLHCENKK